MSAGNAGLDLLLAEGRAVTEAAGLASLEGQHIVVSGAGGLLGTTLLASLAAARSGGIQYDLTLLMRSVPTGEVGELARLSGARICAVNFADLHPMLDRPADVLIHAAGASAPIQFMERPLETLALGACATLRLLAAVSPGGRFLFVSSTEVYSGFSGARATEADMGTTTPLHPRASYIEAKRVGETACVGARSGGVNAVAARVGMTYGPGTRPGDSRVVNRLIEQAICRGRVELLDSGDAVRPISYVADTVELLWRAALEGQAPIYNVAGPEETSIRDLASKVCDLTEAELFIPSTAASVPGAPESVCVDSSRATREFGKSVWVSLEEGLSRTIAWQTLLYDGKAKR